MNAGRLRDQITIQYLVTAKSTFSRSGVEDWQEFATVRCGINHLSGNQAVAAQQVYADATHRIEMRYLEGVVPKMRALDGARIFDILEVDRDRKHLGEMFLTVSEKV